MRCGLSWKGIGGVIGKIVGMLEAPLWDAELDTAIADVLTLAKPADQRSESRELPYPTADRGCSISRHTPRSRPRARPQNCQG